MMTFFSQVFVKSHCNALESIFPIGLFCGVFFRNAFYSFIFFLNESSVSY